MTRRKCKQGRTVRAVTLRRLVAQLELGPMTATQFSEFLDYGASGGRKYARELCAAGIVTCSISGPQRLKTYTIIADKAAIEQHLTTLDLEPFTPRTKPRSALAIAQRSTGRQFHLLADDMFNLHKVPSTNVAPDPLALPRTFFAESARAALRDDEILRTADVMVIEVGAQRCFPSPAEYRLDLSPEVRS